MHEIIAAGLNVSNVTNGEVLSSLLKQIRRRIDEVSCHRAYDTRQYFESKKTVGETLSLKD
ncbi:hypothetical protein BTN50_0135 [Candidatus Enterovibrio altilux]|uniref:Mobile element protein n=1 Tax=Candidatus Enterovibrio altilux TaxID=1927128 RepID=A0A291B6Q8_9GAMM|nr:hypothetical protein BTN50_0135 [Candidatus Enterovibrio luxaltus]